MRLQQEFGVRTTLVSLIF